MGVGGAETVVPWSQVEKMLEMAQAALQMKSSYAEKLLEEKTRTEQELRCLLSQAQRLQKNAVLNAEQLRQTLETTDKDKQFYAQRTEELGVELRSQEHAMDLLEEENDKLEQQLMDLKAKVEDLDVNEHDESTYDHPAMNGHAAQNEQQPSPFSLGSSRQHANGHGDKLLKTSVEAHQIEAVTN